MKKLFFGLMLALISLTSVNAQNGHFNIVAFDTQDLIYKEDCGSWEHFMSPAQDDGAKYALLRTSDKEIKIFVDEPTEWVWLNEYGAEYHVKKINQHEFHVKSNGFPKYWDNYDILNVVFKKTNNF